MALTYVTVLVACFLSANALLDEKDLERAKPILDEVCEKTKTIGNRIDKAFQCVSGELPSLKLNDLISCVSGGSAISALLNGICDKTITPEQRQCLVGKLEVFLPSVISFGTPKIEEIIDKCSKVLSR